jgi:hypothetical protein
MSNSFKQVQRELASNLKEADKRVQAAEAAVKKAAEEFNAAKTAQETAQTQASKFAEVFPDLEIEAPKATKRGGRRKATTKAAAAPKRRKAKAAAKTEAAPKTRRKRGSGPTMVETMTKVMGKRIMSAGQVKEAMEAKGKAPESNDLKGYISTVFSSATDENGNKVFEKVERGKYRVAGVATASKAKAETKKTTKAKSETKTTKAKSTKSETKAAAKSETKTESKPETKTESKPADPADPAAAMLAEQGIDLESIGQSGSNAQSAAPLS